MRALFPNAVRLTLMNGENMDDTDRLPLPRKKLHVSRSVETMLQAPDQTSGSNGVVGSHDDARG